MYAGFVLGYNEDSYYIIHEKEQMQFQDVISLHLRKYYFQKIYIPELILNIHS